MSRLCIIFYSSCTSYIISSQVEFFRVFHNVNISYNLYMNFTWKINSSHYSCWRWQATMVDIVVNGWKLMNMNIVAIDVKFMQIQACCNNGYGMKLLLKNIVFCGWWCQKKPLMPKISTILVKNNLFIDYL